MTANPPKISLLFTGDEFCSTIIVIASPPPMAFFGIRNRRLSPSAYRQNSPPTAKNTTATFRFPDSGMVCLPQPSACAYACGFPSCFMIWLSLFPCSFPRNSARSFFRNGRFFFLMPEEEREAAGWNCRRRRTCWRCKRQSGYLSS